MTLEGVDVSHLQGEIVWAQVRRANKRFAIIKATEGTDFFDPSFTVNRQGAHDAGLVVGAYHFAHFYEDADAQAEWFLERVGSTEGELPPAVDLETGGFSTQDPIPDPDQVVQWIQDFVAAVHEETGGHPMLYTDPGFWEAYTRDATKFSRRHLWLARWGSSPEPLPGGWSSWTFWQHAEGHVPGVGGNAAQTLVDLDRFNGTEQDLAALTS